jgi:hypothetical protein
MSEASVRTAAILLIAVPAVEIGGLSLLMLIARKLPGYLDNPVRQSLFRAGHAHAGVWIIFALVGMLYVDQAALSDAVKTVVRYGFAAAPILAPLGFFLSALPNRTERPGPAIALVYLAGIALGVATVTLGIGLLKT